jgi:isopenicillin-N epimerase
MTRPAPASPLARHWQLDPDVVFLNHGSFGACPREVLATQAELRARMERQPVQFLVRDLEGELDAARQKLAEFLGADAEGLAFVTNATVGVNTVLANLRLHPGDELLVTDHGYAACRNAVNRLAQRTGARVVVAQVPFPLQSPDEVLNALDRALTSNTRFCLIDHVTSPTALVFPVERIVPWLQARGVAVLVDGAHAPGMLPLDLAALNADYYTGNCHKWLCSPKGAAFLHVRADLREGFAPLMASHGMAIQRPERSRFRLEFDWTGTSDPTPWLAIPAALAFMENLQPGGWHERMRQNHALALQARDILCTALDMPPPAPDAMLGSMAAILLPDLQIPPQQPSDHTQPPLDALQDHLWHAHRIEVPVMDWPSPRVRLIRVSAQAYNSAMQYDFLAEQLRALR